MRGSEERTGPVRRTPDSDEHRTRWLDRTPTDHVARFGWPDRIRRTRSRRRLHRSCQHLPARSRQGGSRSRHRYRRRYAGGAREQLAPFAFSQVDVHLNDTLVTPSSNTYPFRAYVETLLSYGAEAKKTQLTSQLWYKDTAGHMEATQENGGNAGLVERRRHIAGSRVVEMMGRLHVDLFMQDRFLINGVTVKIRLVRSKVAAVADGRRREPRLQGAHSGCCPVRAQGRVEFDGGDGAHTGVGEGNGEVSTPPGRLQGILDTTGRPVEHAREPVPRNAAETHHPVVRRQRRAQRCIRKKTHFTRRTTPLTS